MSASNLDGDIDRASSTYCVGSVLAHLAIGCCIAQWELLVDRSVTVAIFIRSIGPRPVSFRQFEGVCALFLAEDRCNACGSREY